MNQDLASRFDHYSLNYISINFCSARKKGKKKLKKDKSLFKISLITTKICSVQKTYQKV